MVGYVGLVGLVWFVLEGSKSNTVSHSLSHSKQSPKVGIKLLGQLKKVQLICNILIPYGAIQIFNKGENQLIQLIIGDRGMVQ